MKKEYIGGRFPKRLKDIIQERANANGQSMNEYLEGLLTNVLDNDQDGQIQESQYNELLEKLNNLEQAKENAMETIIENPIIEATEPTPEDEIEVVEGVEDQAAPIIEESIVEVVETLAVLPMVDGSPIEALRQSLPPILAGELNAEIAATWSSINGTTEEPKNKVLIADFFESLAENLTGKAATKRKLPPRNQDELLITLPPSYQAEIIPIIEAALLEFKGDIPKDRFFNTLADLLNDAADRLYIEARAFDLTFTRAEYSLIEQMLERTNKRREKPLVDLQAWIFYKLGEALEDAGDGGVFGRDNEPMLELAKMMIERGENRKDL